MTTVEKINYMIACLQIAKEEAEYLEHYKEREQKVSEDHDKWWSWYCKNRVPNKALIKDNLRNAARTGFVVAKMVEKNGNQRRKERKYDVDYEVIDCEGGKKKICATIYEKIEVEDER